VIYLSGTVRPNLRHPRLGFMNTPQMQNEMPVDVTWGADNGRFAAPEFYSNHRYLAWLRRQRPARCLFATAPDVVGSHGATLELSRPVLPMIRAAGYPPAFVAQDGWDEDTTPWDDFDVLFVGGTTSFKLGAGGEAIAVARARGKRVHMGRVNSFTRLRVAAALGCESADGTFLKFAPDQNEPRMLRWLDQLSAVTFLPMGGQHGEEG